jgi:isocitrate dehydrogenase kinase/phosphatase
MLQLTFPAIEGWDEKKEEFVTLLKEETITLEHSLISLSKWESKWHKPFLTKEEKTVEETIDYIRCMTLTQNVKPETYNRIRNEHIEQINAYIEDSMTATWFKESNNRQTNKEIITSEVIYYWMITLNIPVNFEKWHLNRLLTLIRVCNENNKPKKKVRRSEMLEQRRMLNNARKKKWNTKG